MLMDEKKGQRPALIEHQFWVVLIQLRGQRGTPRLYLFYMNANHWLALGNVRGRMRHRWDRRCGGFCLYAISACQAQCTALTFAGVRVTKMCKDGKRAIVTGPAARLPCIGHVNVGRMSKAGYTCHVL